MKNRLLFLSLACVMANAMIKVEIVGLAGPKCICDMRRDQTIEEVKQEVVLKTGFVATDILKGTEHLDFKATLGDVASDESHVMLTVLNSDPLEMLKQILQEKTGYVLTDGGSGLSLKFRRGDNQTDHEIWIKYSSFGKEQVIEGLLSAMRDFDPSVETNVSGKLKKYEYHSVKIVGGSMHHLFINEDESRVLEFMVGEISSEERHLFAFSEYILNVALRRILDDG